MLKTYLKSYLYSISTLFALFIGSTVLNYFDLISNNLLNILKIIFVTISIIVGAFFIGRASNDRGYLEGIKFGLIFVAAIIVINIIFFRNFNLGLLFTYIIIVLASVGGSIIGINTKRKK